MELVSQAALDLYLRHDVILRRLDELSVPLDEHLVCQRWLRGTPAKRYIFSRLYEPLFQTERRLKVLDVGGGITAFTGWFARNHDYVLTDILAHDSAEVATGLEREAGRSFIRATDWAALEQESWDIVIANDLFPNVDQRLAMFLDQFLPLTTKLLVSLTFYNTYRTYQVKRVDADEMFCMLAWDGVQTARALSPFKARLHEPDFGLFQAENASVYPNGRQVVLASLTGEQA